MRHYKVNFTTEYGTPIFGTIPDIIKKSEIKGLEIKFLAGGWDAGNIDICYHEWSCYDVEDNVVSFLTKQYGNSLKGIEVDVLENGISES